jgi:hypothetical protein
VDWFFAGFGSEQRIGYLIALVVLAFYWSTRKPKKPPDPERGGKNSGRSSDTV